MMTTSYRLTKTYNHLSAFIGAVAASLKINTAGLAIIALLLLGGVVPGVAKAAAAISSDYLMQKLANKFNDKKAQYIMGRKYYTGTGVQQNMDIAVQYFIRSARQNYDKALFQLGKMNLYGEGVPTNYLAAYEFLNRAVEQDNTEAKYELANLLFHDQYGHKDTQRAISLYRQAAENRDINAQYMLGTIYYEGLSAEVDKIHGEAWLRQSADGGNVDAIEYLELIKEKLPAPNFSVDKTATQSRTESTTSSAALENDSDSISDQLLKVGSGDAEPVQNGGTGIDDIPPSVASEDDVSIKEKQRAIANTLYTYLQQADNGSVKAQYELGMMYLTGTEVTRDRKKAVFYLQKAAENNNQDARMQLVDLYLNSAEFDIDYTAAAKWLKKAAEQGNAEAQYTLGNLYYSGLGVEKNNALAVKWYRSAARQGHNKARTRLGGCRIC